MKVYGIHYLESVLVKDINFIIFCRDDYNLLYVYYMLTLLGILCYIQHNGDYSLEMVVGKYLTLNFLATENRKVLTQ